MRARRGFIIPEPHTNLGNYPHECRLQIAQVNLTSRWGGHMPVVKPETGPTCDVLFRFSSFGPCRSELIIKNRKIVRGQAAMYFRTEGRPWIMFEMKLPGSGRSEGDSESCWIRERAPAISGCVTTRTGHRPGIRERRLCKKYWRRISRSFWRVRV